MRLTKFTHACVRLERGGAVLVIDPGSFSEEEALAGADAVLITHEHHDHLDVDKLTRAAAARPELPVYAHPDVVSTLADTALQVHPVQPGDEFTAAGFRIRVGGGAHAVIHPDIPRIANVGYLIEDSLYHPGDSVDPADLPPGAEVETLLLPVNAPWLKLSESVDYARAVAPRRAYALHDHLLSPAGTKVYGTNLGKLAGCDYQRLEPGTSVDLA
ncbi:MAG TPA: MBL fold metallo-hydrolase [Natronosporangium sp.]|nr:MBL fold metallo-hydrolase [Natronosporangium sp.]